ncbi:MAG: CvpA family protein [Aestuariivirga sp.]|jgi:membrane protein required for colicin V production
MKFQILDFILVGIMLVSGLLALARGFTREVLSLVAWGLAALAAYFATKQKPIMDVVAPHFEKPIIAQIAVAAGAFIIVLIIVSVISVKVSDRVVDSSVGAFDRTLGFFYGLARGLILVAIAYLFYGWLLPPEKQEDWVRNAVTLPAIRTVSNTMLAYMPPDIAETLSNSGLIGNQDSPSKPEPTTTESITGYQKGQTKGLENLIEGTTKQ